MKSYRKRIIFAFTAFTMLPLTPAFPQAQPRAEKVSLMKIPNEGIQPQVTVDAQGTVHMIYFKGEPGGGDVFYVKKGVGEKTFSTPLQVNSQAGSVIATGTIRGAHLAVGKNGRVHVSWMGASVAQPKGPGGASPMLYTRLNDKRSAFEPQRNVMQFAVGLDGGGSVAADPAGNVYVAWHGRGEVEGEDHRQVYLARSTDEGKTFAREKAAFNEPTGACGCCGMRAFAPTAGQVYLIYRTATEMVNRDMYLLSSKDGGEHFQGMRLHNWKIGACPMSSVSFSQGAESTLVTWETDGQVYYTSVEPSLTKAPGVIAPPLTTGRRKHSVLAVNNKGETLLAWTEGMGWKKSGSLAWQVYGKDGKPTEVKGEAPGVPVWSLVAVAPRGDGGFVILY